MTLIKLALEQAIETMAEKANITKIEMAQLIANDSDLQEKAQKIAKQGLDAFFEKKLKSAVD